MNNNEMLDTFLRAANAWVCDGYALDIRYMAGTSDAEWGIWAASVGLNPLPPEQDLEFHIETPGFVTGQHQQQTVTKKKLLMLLDGLANGVLNIGGKRLILGGGQPPNYYTNIQERERWFYELHLQVSGTQSSFPTPLDFVRIDNDLRCAKPPFDGLSDLATWLGLGRPATLNSRPAIDIRVHPPVDLIFDRSGLAGGKLSLTLHAHPKLDLKRIGLAVRSMPTNSLDGRLQIADSFQWGGVKNNRREGFCSIDVGIADASLAVLMIEGSVVRRQWFVDPSRARNNRTLAASVFDKDLRMTRDAVLDSPDSSKFEKGVASLLFLLGFSPCVQLETDAPDLIVTTPGGRLVIVECTTRTSDFAAKVGKLVDRRGALSKALAESGHSSIMEAVLVCRTPRDQLTAHSDLSAKQRVIVATLEDLHGAFDRVRYSNDPDQILQEALNRLSTNSFPLSTSEQR